MASVEDLTRTRASRAVKGETETERADRLAAEVSAWIERHVGPVVGIERQARWRPAWFVDVKKDDRLLRLYVRGAREGGGNVYPLDQEAAVLQVLEAHGILVPHVYGVIPDPWAIVMDRLPGRANAGTIEDKAEQRSTVHHYVELLAGMHAIPASEFEAIGLATPKSAEELALSWFNRVEDRYRSCKKRPEPLIEFVIKWVRRNVPTHRNDPRFLHFDSGQFLFENGRVTGVLDLEFSHIGDIAHDLGSLRLRDIPEPLGDVGAALRHYETVSGAPLDLDAIDFHTVKWVLCTPMSLITTMHAMPKVVELLQYIEWFHQYSLTAVEGIANMTGVSLPDVGLPEPVPTRFSGVHEATGPAIRSLGADDAVARFRRDSTAKMAEYLQRVDVYGPAVEAADLDDMAPLIGRRPVDWQDGDAALEAFVLSAGPEHDTALVKLFQRRAMRQMRLLEPVLTRTKSIVHLAPLRELLGR